MILRETEKRAKYSPTRENSKDTPREGSDEHFECIFRAFFLLPRKETASSLLLQNELCLTPFFFFIHL